MAYSMDRFPDQTGRTAIVTGANTGLGFHNARDLAAKGATVVMACRSADRAEAARVQILDEVPDGDVTVRLLDLSSLASVRDFAAGFRDDHRSLDLLINNAGIMATPYERTEDGFEGQMAANYWGHFLLSSLLFDLMPDQATSRIVSLSSLAHISGAIRWDDIHWEKHYDPRRAYSQTKLACLMFAIELDRRLRADDRRVLSVAAHPGLSLTELTRSMPAWQVGALRYTIAPFFTHRSERASLSTLAAALDPKTDGGWYYGPKGFNELRGDPGHATVHRSARHEAYQERLWDLSCELTGTDWPF